MTFVPVSYPADKSARYEEILAQASALMEGESHPIVHLANISALLYHALGGVNWCGFYLLNEGSLLLGPFGGLPACMRIPLNRGVCGKAARTDTVQRIDDVHAFPGHIACDSASNSEIVIPLHHDGQVIGVLDIDSPQLSRFDDTDEHSLRELALKIEKSCDWSNVNYSLS